MHLLAIVGSPRKGKATDTLVDKAIEGARSKNPDLKVKKIHLSDYNIEHCRNCLACRETKTDDAYAKCVIRDDMDAIKENLVESDVLIMATPVHMGYATAIMTAFLERIAWAFTRPEGKFLMLRGLPTIPRSNKKRKAVIIVPSGIITPLYRRFCDWATPLIRRTIKDALNAKTIGDLYAGDIEHRGVQHYFHKAHKLGRKLA